MGQDAFDMAPFLCFQVQQHTSRQRISREALV
jgi:hypothetical protein